MNIAAQQLNGKSGAVEIFLVAAEASGDRLGAALMQALRERANIPLHFSGVGGREMTAAGLENLYPIDDFSIIGIVAIPRRLPRILAHLYATVRAVLARKPHALVIIDSPDYTLRVARLVRKFDRSIPIVDYVSPSVWAWRSGRARSMRRYVDHVLALLPFEPDAHRRLGGPPCTYVGHPLIEEVAKLRPNEAEAARRRADPPVILCLPGSRIGEIQRLSEPLGRALGLVAQRIGAMELVVPTVPHLLTAVTRATAAWPVRPRIVVEPADKQAAFRVARAALAKSGTVTLELALAGIPMVTTYRVNEFEAFLVRRLVRVRSYILANLVLGENVVPELLQEDCTPDRLAAALVPLIGDTPDRQRQLDAFARLDEIMEIGSRSPAARAADIVFGSLRRPDRPTSELAPSQ
jgi:lipid-A-disaccharide synthase